ncbi:MAG: leucine-rich repeat protein [Clostridia bacterium]|nr:leucine-rich repeat protein [Clostridia bacterium]
MKRTNRIILTVVIVAMLVLGVGYAAIQNITLNITGTAAADPSQSNFKVMFSGTPTVSDETYVTAAVTNDTNATINVEGLTKVGDVASATYTVQNASTDLSADLSVLTTNDNTEYFTLSSELEKTSLVAGEATALTVTVELTKTPLEESVSATIGVQLTAMPVQPGEEGTSEGINDYSQTPDERNEYGFYFDQAYTTTIENQQILLVFHEDTSCDMYADGILMEEIPTGILTYDSYSIDASAIELGVLTVSSDGRQITVPATSTDDAMVFELDTSYGNVLNGGTAIKFNEPYVISSEGSANSFVFTEDGKAIWCIDGILTVNDEGYSFDTTYDGNEFVLNLAADFEFSVSGKVSLDGKQIFVNDNANYTLLSELEVPIPAQLDGNGDQGEFFVVDNRELLGYTGEENEHFVIPETFIGEDGITYKVVQIDGQAFYPLTNLDEITIPATVAKIDGTDYMFANKINVDSNNENYCSVDGVLYTKDMKKILRYPLKSNDTSFNIPDGVTTINFSAFTVRTNYQSSNLTTLYIPTSVTEFGYSNQTTSITDIYYAGTEEEWKQITNSDTVFTNATIHYSSAN